MNSADVMVPETDIVYIVPGFGVHFPEKEFVVFAENSLKLFVFMKRSKTFSLYNFFLFTSTPLKALLTEISS